MACYISMRWHGSKMVWAARDQELNSIASIRILRRNNKKLIISQKQMSGGAWC